jgi:hypothetical protein
MGLDKNQIYVIDDFVDKKTQNQLLEDLLKPNTPFFYSSSPPGIFSINDPKYIEPIGESQFCHGVKPLKTPFLKILENQFNFKILETLRTKINWVNRELVSSKNKFYPPHTDGPEDHWVFIYYFNTSDGNTLLFKETQNNPNPKYILNIQDSIEHKMGRGLLFHGYKYHCGLPPIENPYRILINHNFIIK